MTNRIINPYYSPIYYYYYYYYYFREKILLFKTLFPFFLLFIMKCFLRVD